MPNQDYAILVGVKDYADPAFPPLNGPVRDVALMKAWLTSPSGGNLSADHILTIESPNPLPKVPANQLPPVAATFSNEFAQLILDDKNRPISRPQSRLYLYFSGHGFCQLRDQMPRASLYTANANRVFCDSIPGTFFALWTKDAALFKDVVIVMDCCRDAEFAKTEAIPSLLQMPKLGTNVDVFGIYAAPKGGKALERPISSRNNEVHGLLTHAVIEALENAPGDANGVVSSEGLASYIRARWSAICGNDPADPPEFAHPTLKPLALVSRNGNLVCQRLGVAAWTAGEAVELSDGRLNHLATLMKSSDGT
ncbi:MAG TPA: caspase family protein, partial [Nitrospira sp.]